MILRIATAVLVAVIFVVDTITDLEIAVAVLYVAVALLLVRFCRLRGALLVTAGCVIRVTREIGVSCLQ